MSSPAGSPGGRRFVGSPPFWFGLVMMVVAVPLGLLLLQGPPRRVVELPLQAAPDVLPVLGTVPPLALLDQEGRAFDNTRLQGRPFVANFIFTTCPTVCPLLTQELAKVERKSKDLGDRVRFVSFTVDPENDTPAALKAFGDKFQVDWARWTFVTGPVDALGAVVEQGFRIGVSKEKKAGDVDLYEIVHGEHFVLVDGAGRIRGYYANTDEAHERLVQDLAKLVGGGPT